MSIKSISSIKHFLGYEQKRMLASSLILSKLDYCNSIYFGTHSNNLRKLQSVQNSAARLIFGSQTNHPYPVLFNTINCIGCQSKTELDLRFYSSLTKLWMVLLHPTFLNNYLNSGDFVMIVQNSSFIDSISRSWEEVEPSKTLHLSYGIRFLCIYGRQKVSSVSKSN